jgi:hypothetical protein
MSVIKGVATCQSTMVSISSGILERGILHATYQNPAAINTGRVLLKRSDSVLAMSVLLRLLLHVLLRSATLSAEE